MTRTNLVLLRCGVLAGPLFVIMFLIEGATRPSYDPMRHPVSSLALGPTGWTQVVNFLVTGALYVAFAVGLLRMRSPAPSGPRTGAILIGVVGVGLLGAGAFVTDPVSGYPPGTADLHVSYTTSGALHDGFSVLVFLGFPGAAGAYAWWFLRHGRPGWAGYSLGSAVAFLVAFGFASAAFSQAPSVVDYGGLIQRATIIIGWTWLTLLALYSTARVGRP